MKMPKLFLHQRYHRPKGTERDSPDLRQRRVPRRDRAESDPRRQRSHLRTGDQWYGAVLDV